VIPNIPEIRGFKKPLFVLYCVNDVVIILFLKKYFEIQS
jgi:hypothetical protein